MINQIHTIEKRTDIFNIEFTLIHYLKEDGKRDYEKKSLITGIEFYINENRIIYFNNIENKSLIFLAEQKYNEIVLKEYEKNKSKIEIFKSQKPDKMYNIISNGNEYQIDRETFFKLFRGQFNFWKVHKAVRELKKEFHYIINGVIFEILEPIKE